MTLVNTIKWNIVVNIHDALDLSYIATNRTYLTDMVYAIYVADVAGVARNEALMIVTTLNLTVQIIKL